MDRVGSLEKVDRVDSLEKVDRVDSLEKVDRVGSLENGSIGVEVWLSLGANLGCRECSLQLAVELLTPLFTSPLRCSSLYQSEPWGFESEDNFLNMVVGGTTSLEPLELLAQIHLIEKRIGRNRKAEESVGRDHTLEKRQRADNSSASQLSLEEAGGYSSRLIDIDILYYGEQIIHHPTLQIPHPHIKERKFVLAPLNELSPNFIDPHSGLTIFKLLELCPDNSAVTLYGPLY